MERRERDNCQLCQLWLTEEQPGFDPQVEEDVNLAVVPLLTTTFAKAEFLESNPGTPLRASPPYFII